MTLLHPLKNVSVTIPMLQTDVVFDKYHEISTKDHERMQRASEVVIDYDLSIASHLPNA